MWWTPGGAGMTFSPQPNGTVWPLMTAVGLMKTPVGGRFVTILRLVGGVGFTTREITIRYRCRVRIGFGLPVSGSWATREHIARVATRAEELGYHSLWSFQRLLSPADG